MKAIICVVLAAVCGLAIGYPAVKPLLDSCHKVASVQKGKR